MKGPEMTVDEMELIGRLGEVEPLSDESFAQARSMLRAAIDAESEPEVIGLAARPTRRRRTAIVAVGVAAAMAATTLVVTSHGSSPTVPAAAKHGASVSGRSAKSSVSTHAASPLLRLAAYVRRSTTPAGNATLVARTTRDGAADVTVYDLYSDNGQYFFSQTESGLAGEVSAGHDLGNGVFAREIAAAKLAASGNVKVAAQDMADAPDPSVVVSPSEHVDSAAMAAKWAAGHPNHVISPAPTPARFTQTGNLFDNWAWENSLDAIIAGSSDPQVRAGVLQILATLPDVTVTEGTSGGQPTLVLTAGNAEFGDSRTEQLTINANTGVPVSFASGTSGQALSGAVSYQVSRVTTSDIAAGRI